MSYLYSVSTVVYDTDPTRPIGDWKEAREKAKQRAGAILRGESDEPQLAKVEEFRRGKKEGPNPGKGTKGKKKGYKACVTQVSIPRSAAQSGHSASRSRHSVPGSCEHYGMVSGNSHSHG
jgi:hypothetical protein